jgi:hypothetical protein
VVVQADILAMVVEERAPRVRALLVLVAAVVVEHHPIAVHQEAVEGSDYKAKDQMALLMVEAVQVVHQQQLLRALHMVAVVVVLMAQHQVMGLLVQ